ncbi:F0F1 ATP synthase subunit B [Gorillibacterium massiliense]|uniref:F0F1 ATP synthase subunit B n=1 Tax=Gorillibacterium massiliense TaxID=1280390 RepID=UPI0004B141A2|nr:F0F1 ATP synthase subunit B [Gorillibacterium massiliense]
MSFNYMSFLITIIAFGILYWLLSKYAFGPLFAMMEKRREHIQNEIQTAEKNRSESVQYLEQQKQALDGARKEALGIVEQARQASVRQADDILGHAREEASRLKDDMVEQIQHEKDKAVVALRSQVSAMSVMIASKIIEKQVDEQTQKELVDKYLQEVGDKS